MNRHRPSISSEAGPKESDQKGYAAVLTALVLVPLFGFAGFAVDVGAWYAQASSIQRAADAASLAGVVWQPDFSVAESAAREEATRNGFTDGVDDITVIVTDVGDNQLEVEIVDGSADMYFAGLFLDGVTIGRGAVAEYVDAVPMGSPKNHFGTHDLLSSGPENFHAAINGSCTPREQGDHRSVHFMNNWWSPGYSNNMLCPTAGGGPGPDTGGSSGNTTWNPNPYYVGDYSFGYYIDVPTALASGVNLYLRDPNFDPGGPIDSSGGSFTTSFRLRAPDATPLDDTDNPLYTSCATGRASGDGVHAYPAGSATGSTSLFSGDGSTWDLFCQILPGATGRFILEVGTAAFEADSFGSNSYALLAQPLGSSLTCDTRTDPACPAVVAKDWMSIFANLSGSAADFYLAEIGDEHEGKRMRVTLFDPGEGSDFLQILDPDGNPVAFSWATTDGSFSGSGTSLSVSSTCSCYRPTGNASTYQFSDRFVEITIDLPADFATAYSASSRWWKIYYNTGSAPTDRTSWSVEILGDPVRLLE